MVATFITRITVHVTHKGKKVRTGNVSIFRNKCPARVTTAGATIVRSRGEHNHAGDATHVEAAKAMENIRRM